MRYVLGLALTTLVATAPLHSASGQPNNPAAIVYSLVGAASHLDRPGKAARPVALFDWLPAGTVLKVASGSRLALAFASGNRWALGGGATATLGSAGLAFHRGDVRPLQSVPHLPVAPVRNDERDGWRTGARVVPGAISVRSETISGLYPDRGSTSLASAVQLRFKAVPPAPKYRVEIIDQESKVVFRIETEASEVAVPPETVAPGRSYRWTVETLDRPGAMARGEATLVTLDASQAQAREELRRWAQSSGAMDDLQLLEGVDKALGLREESRPAAEDARCPFSSPGVVVETVSPESAAFRAGLTPGDRLFSWCRAPGGEGDCVERGALRTPFDWLDLQIEAVQRGGVVIAGARGPENLRWNLLPTFQGLTVAPLLDGPLAEVYKASRDREQAGDPASAGKDLERAADLADGDHCADAALWLRARAAQLRALARQWPEADAGFEDALAKAQVLGAANVEAHLRMSWSEAFVRRGDLAQARKQVERALWLEEKDHPESPRVVTVLVRLGNVIEKQDNLEEADRLYRRAHDLVLSAAPGGGAEAATANNLAVSTGRRGDLAQAEVYAARALAIREKLTPSGDAIIPSLLGYGNVIYSRGDFAGAEAAFLRARKILEEVQPESEALAKTLHNLGEVAFVRGDYDAAEDLFQRERALFEKLDSTAGVRDSLVGLGEVALRQGQGEKAEDLWQRALAISEKLNPTGPQSAHCLRGLAEATRLQGRGAEAERLLRRALAIWQAINPEAAETGSVHLSLGLLLLEQGSAEAAENHLRTAIRLYEKDRRQLPEGYQALARLQGRRGRPEEAAVSYRAAIDALERQGAQLGGARESQWLYGSSLGDLYFEAAEHEIALARPQEAWKFLERGRARGFQELLAKRDLRFATELPAELYAERHRLDAEYDRVQAALADWVPQQGLERIEALQGRLRDLRLDQAKIQERMQRSSPRLGTLGSPTPLDVAAARSMLDPGTALLTYAVGETQSFLFVIEAEGSPGPGFFFYPLLVGRESLAREVEAFRRLLSQPDTLLSTVKQHGQHVYDLLVRPAEPVLSRANRWLISPDGPLHSLPFAALVSGDRYLAESKPLHIAASAAIYKELKATRSKMPSAAALDLLLVGDPFYPPGLDKQSDTATDPQVRTALRRGLELKPLPATRSEVQAISSLFPSARVLLGRDATEEAVKSLAPRARRLHFASHGLLDGRFPLNSALALSIPEHPEEGRPNGLLQAWEVFEELRLDADLVTLSACDSGLGKEMGGEGLIGLVRAFQFAGARSVLASLWSVSDTSTADLMKRFYLNLHQTKTKDEALRAAQLDLIHSQTFSHPYHWAAFQLFGDWK